MVKSNSLRKLDPLRTRLHETICSHKVAFPRLLSSALAALGLAFAISGCSETSNEAGTGGQLGTRASGGHDSHGHDSHGHHPHPDTGTSSSTGTQPEFIPELVGSAPPDPGPRDCSALAPTGIEIGNVAPNFTLLNAFGKPVRLHDYCNHVVSLISGTMSCSH